MIALDRIEHAHFVGIGGIGMSGLARLVMEAGLKVSGSDVKESSLTRALAQEGAKVHIGHSAQHVARGPDLVVYSTAVPEDNPERVAAAKLGVACLHRAELLAAFVAQRISVGVTGTHGKGTVSSMITWILDAAGHSPGFCIGGMVLNYGTNARAGGGEVLVAEIDESDGSHLQVQPNHTVLHFLELDHLNYYSGIDDIVSTARTFLESNPRLQTVCVNAGCAGVRSLLDSLSVPVVTYALDGSADWTGRGVELAALSVGFDVWRRGDLLGRVQLPIPGAHNAENALAAITLCAEGFEVPFQVAADALSGYLGLENRFTVVDSSGCTLVKDYLSHPTGMQKVLSAARLLGPGRLVAVYKPYRFTLLRYLGDEYAQAFELADHVVLTNLYSAGEAPIDGIGDQYLVDKCRGRGLEVTHVPNTEDIPGFLDGYLQAGDVVVLFGGDDFFRMADAYAERRRGQSGPS